MTHEEISATYRNYVSCLNRHEWLDLGEFVDESVVHNDRRLGLSKYRAMLEQDVRQVPDLRFDVGMLIADPPFLAVRLQFDCVPTSEFLGLPVNGRRIRFCENAFYRFDHGRIAQVWSAIDKVAIEAQL